MSKPDQLHSPFEGNNARSSQEELLWSRISVINEAEEIVDYSLRKALENVQVTRLEVAKAAPTEPQPPAGYIDPASARALVDESFGS